jgi:hypothetical protein
LIISQTGFTYNELRLYDSAGNQLAQTYYGNIDYQLPANATPGDYYVRAGGYYQTGNYNLNVQLQTTAPIQTGSTAPGDYYLLLKTDASNGIVEINESNNIIASTTTIHLDSLVRPDLSIIGSIPITPAYIQSTIPISWTVTNDLNADPAISGWSDYVYLSNDQTLDNSDIVLTSTNRSSAQPSLGAGESYTSQANITLPG